MTTKGRKPRKRKVGPERACIECGTAFNARGAKKRFCSPKCRKANWVRSKITAQTNIKGTRMKKEIDSVREFHNACGVPVRSEPVGIKDEEIRLRLRLINEEVREWLYAIVNRDLVGIAQEAADTMYVVAGTHVQTGTAPELDDLLAGVQELLQSVHQGASRAVQASDWEAFRHVSCMFEIIAHGMLSTLGIPYYRIFDLVHEANMNKRWPDGLIHKDAGGKVIKPEGYVAAKIAVRDELMSLSPVYAELLKDETPTDGEGSDG